MIPISLMVSLELTKFFQAEMIQFDDLMKQGDQRCKVLNMLIHEDLAKVEYIFADKTGTLTSNEMKFISCSIAGKIYSKDQLFVTSLQHSSQPDQQEDKIFHLFWLNLSLCHDVVIDKNNSDKTHVNKYQVLPIPPLLSLTNQ